MPTAEVNRDWSEFLQLLNSHGVEYLIIGAHALAFYGHPRYTGDLDCFVSTRRENVERLFAALREFGFGEGLPTVDEFCEQSKILMMGRMPLRIDVLNQIDGVTFETAWVNRVAAKMGDIPVWFISVDDFKANKEASGRPKDLADLRELD